MKTKLIFAVIAVAIAFCAAPAQAQVGHPQHTAKVPFAFTIGDQQLPAGTYEITQSENRLQFRAIGGSKAAIVTAIPYDTRKAADDSRLQFERKGEGLVLSHMYFGGRNDGIQLLRK